jgi:hypothetical protein
VVGALTSTDSTLSAVLVRDDGAVPESDVAAYRTQARRGAVALVPLCYLLAAVLLTWRLWGNPAQRIVSGNPHDADLFAWFMRYTANAVQHGLLPTLVTTGMNATTGVNLMWNTATLLPGVLLAPVTWLVGPQTTLTILTTVGFFGSATALFWVLRRWDVSTPAAALGGAVYGFSPALLQSSIAHYELLLVFLPPLIVSACARLAVRPTWGRTGAWLGLLLAAQIFISEEIALTTALTCVLVLLVLAASRPRIAIQRVAPTTAGLAIAALVALTLTGSALLTQFHGPLTVRGSSHPLDFYVNDLAGFVTPQGALFFHTAASAAAAASYQGGLPEYLGYLGWPLIVVLAVAAVVTWRRLAGRAATVTLVALCVLSLGSHPLIAGTSYSAVDLPWNWIEKIPTFAPVLTDRLSILADGAAATLLAFGIDEVRKRLPAHWPARLAQPAVLAVAVLCCLPLLPRPLPGSSTVPLPPGWSTVFDRLNLAPNSRVLVLPLPRPSETLPLRWFADSGEPSAMIGGYFIGTGEGGQARLGPQMSRRVPEYLNYLWSEGVPLSSPYRAEADIASGEWTYLSKRGWPVPHTQAALAAMASWRTQAVVADAKVSSPLGIYLVQLLGPPSVQVDDLIAWRNPDLTQPPSRGHGSHSALPVRGNA